MMGGERMSAGTKHSRLCFGIGGSEQGWSTVSAQLFSTLDAPLLKARDEL
jgi:hypothetical protein